jgi:threonine aldolase
MASAEADESVRSLEARAADLLGKEAALLVPTGRMGNLLALLSHGQPGQQVLLHEHSHVMSCEDSVVAAAGSMLARPVAGTDGALDPEAIEREMTRRQYRHVPRTGLVVLENTFDAAGGTVLTREQTTAVCDVAHRNGVPVHLDGSRLFNAAVALGIPAKLLAAPLDSVVFSLNKGLSAPFGAILCGTDTFIEQAKFRREMLGAGSIHKLGIAAAAGLTALDLMVDRLADDHRRAASLAAQLCRLPGLVVDLDRVRTNIVMVDVSGSGHSGDVFEAELAARGVLGRVRDGNVIRLVTHRHIRDTHVRRAVSVFRQVLGSPMSRESLSPVRPLA